MAFDEAVAGRVREALAGSPDVVEKKMFVRATRPQANPLPQADAPLHFTFGYKCSGHSGV